MSTRQSLKSGREHIKTSIGDCWGSLIDCCNQGLACSPPRKKWRCSMNEWTDPHSRSMVETEPGGRGRDCGRHNIVTLEYVPPHDPPQDLFLLMTSLPCSSSTRLLIMPPVNRDEPSRGVREPPGFYAEDTTYRNPR